MQDIISRIKEAVAKDGRSQRAIANDAGISAEALSRILRAKINPTNSIPKLARALNVQPEWLQYGVSSGSSLIKAHAPLPPANTPQYRLRQAFERCGLTQRRIAELAGISRQALSKVLASERSGAEIMPKVCAVIDVSPEWVLHGYPEPHWLHDDAPHPDAISAGERLRQAMERRGWDQTRLSEIAGVSQPAISRVINGHRCGHRVLEDLAIALRVPSQWIITGKGQPSWETPRMPENVATESERMFLLRRFISDLSNQAEHVRIAELEALAIECQERCVEYEKEISEAKAEIIAVERVYNSMIERLEKRAQA